MNCTSSALVLLLLAGCGTTQIVERTLDDAGRRDVVRLCSDSCSATLSYSTHFEVDEPVDEDSLYERLEGGEITLRLSDSRELRGRVGRLPSDPGKWVIGSVSNGGSVVDTVQFPFSSVKNASIAVTTHAGDLRADNDEIILDRYISLPMSSIDEIVVRETRRLRSRGALVGGGVGAVAGCAAGALVGASLVCTCEGGFECLDCIARPESRSEGALVGALIGGILGGVTGLVVGGRTGTRENTIYRFRPDTPHQMSVVIRVGATSKEL